MIISTLVEALCFGCMVFAICGAVPTGMWVYDKIKEHFAKSDDFVETLPQSEFDEIIEAYGIEVE